MIEAQLQPCRQFAIGEGVRDVDRARRSSACRARTHQHQPPLVLSTMTVAVPGRDTTSLLKPLPVPAVGVAEVRLPSEAPSVPVADVLDAVVVVEVLGEQAGADASTGCVHLHVRPATTSPCCRSARSSGSLWRRGDLVRAAHCRRCRGQSSTASWFSWSRRCHRRRTACHVALAAPPGSFPRNHRR